MNRLEVARVVVDVAALLVALVEIRRRRKE